MWNKIVKLIFVVASAAIFSGTALCDESFTIYPTRNDTRKTSFGLTGYTDKTGIQLFSFVSNNDELVMVDSKSVTIKGVRDFIEAKLGRAFPKSGPYYSVRGFPVETIEVKATSIGDGVYKVTEVVPSSLEVIRKELELYDSEKSKLTNADEKQALSENDSMKKKVLALRKRDPSMAKRCSSFLSSFAGKIESMAKNTSIKESDAEAIVKLSQNSKEEKMNCMSFWFEEEQNRYALASTCGQYMAMGPGMIKECYEKSKEE